MSLAKTLPGAILETILNRLAALFLTGAAGDMTASRNAAAQMLTAYDPQTEDELRLAATIVIFSFQALEALGQAATPDISISRVLRLRGSAVSLSRESHKAQRRLDQLQKTRREAQPIQTQPEAAQPAPKAETTVQATQKNLTWTQTHEARQREARIAASLKRAEARLAAHASTDQRPMAHAL